MIFHCFITVRILVNFSSPLRKSFPAKELNVMCRYIFLYKEKKEDDVNVTNEKSEKQNAQVQVKHNAFDELQQEAAR